MTAWRLDWQVCFAKAGHMDLLSIGNGRGQIDSIQVCIVGRATCR
jgi:hypothetical protein